MTKKQQLAQILRLAAEELSNNKNLMATGGMCNALMVAAYKHWREHPHRTVRDTQGGFTLFHLIADQARDLLERTYRHDSPFSRRLFWMGPTTPKRQQHRVVALLMLADAIEQGDF